MNDLDAKLLREARPSLARLRHLRRATGVPCDIKNGFLHEMRNETGIRAVRDNGRGVRTTEIERAKCQSLLAERIVRAIRNRKRWISVITEPWFNDSVDVEYFVAEAIFDERRR